MTKAGFLAAALLFTNPCNKGTNISCYARSIHLVQKINAGYIHAPAPIDFRKKPRPPSNGTNPGPPSNGTNPGAPSNGSKPGPPYNGSGGGNSSGSQGNKKKRGSKLSGEEKCGSRDLNTSVTEVKQLYKNDDDLENLMFEHLEGEERFGLNETELDDCVIDVSINWTEPIVRDDDFYLRLGQEYMYNIQINITQNETVLYNPLFDSPFLVRVSSAPVRIGREHVVRSNFQGEYFSENSSYAEVEVPMILQMPPDYYRDDIFFSTMVNIIFFGTNDTNVVKQVRWCEKL